MLIVTRIGVARATLLLGAGLSFASPVWSQNAALNVASDNAATSPLQAALAQGGTPLEIKVSALNGQWRHFKPNAALNDDSVASSNYSRDAMSDDQTVALRGAVVTGAQKTLAEVIAEKNSSVYCILNELVRAKNR